MDQIVKYDISEAAISQMRKDYLALTIAGIDDKEGFEAVHEARMTVKGKRVEVEKKRKELKADALEWGRAVDKEAKRIFSLLEPIENHLQSEESRITDEKARIKAEEEHKEQQRIQDRIDRLAQFECSLPFFEVAAMTDDQFYEAVQKAAGEFEIEQERKRIEEEAKKRAKAEERRIREEEEARLKIEREKLEAMRKEQEAKETAIKKELEAKAAAIKTEEEKVEAEKRKLAEEKRLEEAKKAAAERALKEQAERQEREEAEKKRKEARKPDKEKCIIWLNKIFEIELPDFDFENDAVSNLFENAYENIRLIVNNTIKELEEL